MSSDSFKNVTNKLFVYKSFIFNICINRICYKKNVLQLIYHESQRNEIKPFIVWYYVNLSYF